MKKNYILFILLFAATTISSCKKDISLSDIEDNNVQSAREIFRTEYLQAIKTVAKDTFSTDNYNPADYEKSLYEGYKLQPGEFTPRWDGANSCESEVSVSILPTFDYLAILYKNKFEIGIIAELPVFPKLIVDLKSSSCHIAYIIPTPEFYAAHADVHNHFKTKDMDFCGIVMNYDFKGNLLNVEKYIDGKLTVKADKQSFTGTDDEYYDLVYKMSGYHYNMGRAVCISTKGGGEGNPGSNYNKPLAYSEIQYIGNSLGGTYKSISLSEILNYSPGSRVAQRTTIYVKGCPVQVYSMSIYQSDYSIRTYGCNVDNIYNNSSSYVFIDGVQCVVLQYHPNCLYGANQPSMLITISVDAFRQHGNYLFGR